MSFEAPWTQHERELLARWAQLSYAEPLQWLWEAKLFAQRALASALARHDDANGRADGAPQVDADDATPIEPR